MPHIRVERSKLLYHLKGNEMGKLTGKTAVITGGNSGIGLSTAKTFIDEGAQVVIFGRDQKSLDDAVETLGDNAIGVQGNVTQDSDLKRLFAATKVRFGKVDILFANAGGARPGPFEEKSEEDFDFVADTNFKGTYFTIQKLLPLMGSGGSIILNTSIQGWKGFPGFSVYAATKAAIRSLARTRPPSLRRGASGSMLWRPATSIPTSCASSA